MKITLTLQQARNFILAHQGLLGDYKFKGSQGVLAFVEQAGCIQYDPIDICGRNSELVLLSRVKNYRKATLSDLLYERRELIDYWDKNLSILSAKDWPLLTNTRHRLQQVYRLDEHHRQAIVETLATLQEVPYLFARDLKLKEKIDWDWNQSTLARAVLESLYFQGKCIIHHKSGTNKAYGLTAKYFPQYQCEYPLWSVEAYHRAYLLRRIRSVGLLWDRPSDAFLGIRQFTQKERHKAFVSLAAQGEIIEVEIIGFNQTFYISALDSPLLNDILVNKPLRKRCELIAPLDNVMWDRKLISALFGFDYKWEIYTPKEERRFGHYVLPILYGSRFIGRLEAVAAGDCLRVKHIWLEPRCKAPQALDKTLQRLAHLNGCTKIEYES